MAKILAAGDLHLGRSAFSGLSNTYSASDMWKLMVDHAVNQAFDVMLLAGDVVDKDNKYFESIGALKEGFVKLEKAGIQVIMIAGNHDYDVLRQIAHSGEHKNVTLLGKEGKWEDVLLENIGVRFVGWSFPNQHVHTNPLDQYPNAIPDSHPIIGVLHGDAFDGKSVYAPFTPYHLNKKSVGIWILGHIHKPGKIEGATVPSYYTGSPLPLSTKETGAHGPMEITVTTTGEISAKWLYLSPIRYEEISVDLSAETNPLLFRQQFVQALLDRTKEIGKEDAQVYKGLVYNVKFSVDSTLLEQAQNEFKEVKDLDIPDGDTNIYVSSFTFTSIVKLDLESMLKEPNPPGLLAQAIVAMERNTQHPLADKMIKQWKEEHKRISATAVFAELPREEVTDEIAKKYLIEECKKILTELVKQPANA